MNTIIEPDSDFQFSGLSLGLPTTMGGSFFTRILNKNKNLYIQTPKSLTKQGFVKSGKKMFCDLMFDINDTMFISWIEKLETTCCNLIYEKSEVWFDNKMEIGDIESVFTSPLKTYKSGKYYLMRTNINNNGNIKIYNENNDILTREQITNETHIVSILEIRGIKFTNKYFQIEIELKQAMIVSPDPFLDSCFIKKPNIPVVSSSFTDDKPIVSPEPSSTSTSSSFLTIKKTEKQIEPQTNEDKTPPIITQPEELFITDDITININNEDELNEIEKILENIETLENKKDKDKIEPPNYVFEEKYKEPNPNHNLNFDPDQPTKITFLNKVETLNTNNEIKEEELKTKPSSYVLTNNKNTTNDDNDNDDEIIIHNEELTNDDIDIGIVDCTNSVVDVYSSALTPLIEIKEDQMMITTTTMPTKENKREEDKKKESIELEYYKKYKEAKDRAKELKETTKNALLELKKLKEKYDIKTNETDDEEEKDLLVI